MNDLDESKIAERFYVLENILIQEKVFLQQGKVTEIVAMMREKMNALERFEGAIGAQKLSRHAEQYSKHAKRIVDLAEENAQHFKAIRNGLRSAIDRFGAMRSQNDVGSYNELGRRMTFKIVGNGYEKKV